MLGGLPLYDALSDYRKKSFFFCLFAAFSDISPTFLCRIFAVSGSLTVIVREGSWFSYCSKVRRYMVKIMTVQYKDILDSLIAAVVFLDKHLSIMYMNPAAEDLFGVSESHTQGKSLRDYFVEGSKTPDLLVEAVLSGKSMTMRHANWHLRLSKKVVVDFTVTPDDDGEGMVLEIQSLDRLLRISRDEAMLASQETTHNMMRSMAHEIKNPLGGILGAAQLLDRELPTPELSEFTRVIIEETDRLRNLTDRMLGPNKMIKRDQLNIHEVLEHVSSVVKLQGHNNVEIIRNYDPSIPDLSGDKELLIQAAMNIVNNAYQALTENDIEDPTITIKTRIRRKHTIAKTTHPLVVEVSIIDNGPGIPPQIMEDIFFPMITGRAEGTGLGLSISQNLIARHEGLIECTSEPGKTEFSIFIPLSTGSNND